MPQPAGGAAPEGFLKELIANQLQVMSMQLAMLSGGAPPQAAQTALPQAPLPEAAPLAPSTRQHRHPLRLLLRQKGKKSGNDLVRTNPLRKGKTAD